MKKFLLLVAVAAVAGAMYVTAAPAGRTAAGPTARQFAALKKQVAKLQKQVKQANEGVTVLGDIMGFCMLHQTVGIAQNGDPSGVFGYRYRDSLGAGTLTTALDLSSTPTYTLLTLNPDPQLDCASLVGLGGLKHTGALARFAHRH